MEKIIDFIVVDGDYLLTAVRTVIALGAVEAVGMMIGAICSGMRQK